MATNQTTPPREYLRILNGVTSSGSAPSMTHQEETSPASAAHGETLHAGGSPVDAARPYSWAGEAVKVERPLDPAPQRRRPGDKVTSFSAGNCGEPTRRNIVAARRCTSAADCPQRSCWEYGCPSQQDLRPRSPGDSTAVRSPGLLYIGNEPAAAASGKALVPINKPKKASDASCNIRRCFPVRDRKQTETDETASLRKNVGKKANGFWKDPLNI